MIYVGVDYSLSCPCVCVSRDLTFTNSFFYYLTDRKSVVGKFNNILGDLHDDYLTDQQRYENNASWVLSIIAEHNKDQIRIMIEDYSFGSKGRVFNLAENCGILKYLLYKNGYQFFTVAPTVVKKYATGKGNATKEGMYKAFLEETQVDLNQILTPNCKLSSPVTDIVDAWYIARYMIKHVEKT
jgi:Holliday junction resolvasome RuvABC endonuclease subunit